MTALWFGSHHLLAGLAALAAGTSGVDHAETAHPAEAALRDYVEGLQKGDRLQLERLFLPEGQFCTLERETDIRCRRFDEVLGGWAKQPDPDATGRVIHRQDAGSDAAAITYELRFDGVDYLMQMAHQITSNCAFRPDLVIVTNDLRDFLRCFGGGYSYRIHNFSTGETIDMGAYANS